VLNGLDLFSGIGGIGLALQPWVRTVCYVEINGYCQRVLRERMRDGQLDDGPIWDDVRTFDPRPWAGTVDIVSGGFPCQDISTAGRGAGLAGKRSGLFWQIVRVVRAVRPAFVFVENVPVITHPARGGAQVVAALAALGFDCRWGVLGADDVGAPHIRKRWWLLAYAAEQGEWGLPAGSRAEGQRAADPERSGGHAGIDADADSIAGAQGRHQQPAWPWGRHVPVPIVAAPDAQRPRQPKWKGPKAQWSYAAVGRADWWTAEPVVGRMVHGLPHRVDRVEGLGNAVVPIQARQAFAKLITGGWLTL
jgi:DNA (cytosine-5)-methyltransferase 1